MACYDGILSEIEPYIKGKMYKKLYSESDMNLKETSDKYGKLVIDFDAYKDLHSVSQPDIHNAAYWNTKFPKKTIRYPKRKVTEHLQFRDIQGVTDIASDIIETHQFTNEDDVANAWNKWCITNIETQTRKAASSTKRFKYKPESKEVWRTPEQTIELGYGDCDDFMILGYYVIRKILMLLSKWEYNTHRLLCQVVFAFSATGKLPRPAGWHANLLWIHSDLQYYSLETTFYANKALTNFGKLPQKYNPMYPLISFTFHGDASFSVHNLSMANIDFKKK